MIVQSSDCLAKFSDTMRWITKNVELVPGKKDRVINPATFINCTKTAACNGHTFCLADMD